MINEKYYYPGDMIFEKNLIFQVKVIVKKISKNQY